MINKYHFISFSFNYVSREESQSGYQLQHNWGKVEVEVAGQQYKVNFAVNTLGFSRPFHVFAA